MNWQHISGLTTLALVAGIVSAQESRHIAPSGGDRLLECARGLFGKVTLRGQFARFPNALACSGDKAALTESVRSAAYRVVEGSDAVLILPEKTFQPNLNVGVTQRLTLTMTWKTFHLQDTVLNWRDAEGNHPFTRQQLDAIAAEMFRFARPVPEYVAYHPKAGDAIVVSRHLTIDLHRFREGQPMIAVGVLTGDEDQFNGPGRLILGEWSDKGLRLRWDSILFPTRSFALGYNDLDKDGTDEVILQAVVGAGNDEKLQMTVFDLAGRELTRQVECTREDASYEEAEGACPITAAEIDIDPAPAGPKQLVAKGRQEDINSRTPNRTIRYKLDAGKYIPQLPVRR